MRAAAIAPPRCDGNQQIVTDCDPLTCLVSETTADCEASGRICDPSAAACIDVECIQDPDCPPPGPTAPGVCVDVQCVDNACVSTSRSC